MATRLFNWIREHITTTGTGLTVTLLGGEAGYVAAGDHPGITNGTLVRYTFEDANLNKEEGIGTWNTGGTFDRTTVLQTIVSGVLDTTSPSRINLSGDAYFMCIATSEALLTADQFGTASAEVCEGDDARLSDARTPVSHNNTEHSDTFWHAGNDGSGSGLDADTVDGIEGVDFLRSDQSDTTVGDLTINKASPYFNINGSGTTNAHVRFQNDGVRRALVYWSDTADQLILSRYQTDGITLDGIVRITATNITYDSNTIWHAGNDGTGSGLDADLLDGLERTGFVETTDAATLTAQGIAELATATEVDAKTDTARIITPDKLAGRTLDAWVVFDGTGTPAISDDFNILSVSDIGTGNYTVTIDNDMATANYCYMTSCLTSGTTDGVSVNLISIAVGSFIVWVNDDNGNPVDKASVCVGLIEN